MTGDEITAAAVDYVRSHYAAAITNHPADASYAAPVVPSMIDEHSPIVAMTLARWAAYPDPAEVPPGWIDRGSWTSETGIQQTATDTVGRYFRDAPARRIPFTCSAGVTHHRYWRAAHRPNRPALVACEHQPESVELPR